jgi:hypothetical protein
MKASPLAWSLFIEAFFVIFDKKVKKFGLDFFQFLVIQTLDSYPDPEPFLYPDSLEMLDRISIRIRTGTVLNESKSLTLVFAYDTY